MEKIDRLLILAAFAIPLLLWKLPWHAQDGPNHKKVAVILERLDKSPAEQNVYRSRLGPLQTNSLFELLYLPASKIMPVDAYEKVYVAFFLVSLLLSYRFFLGAWSPPGRALWVAALPILFHPLFLRGMYNFLASVPLTLLALTVMKKGLESGRWIFCLLFLLVSWTAFLAHPFPFFVLTLGLIFLWIFGTGKNRGLFLLYAALLLFFLGIGFLKPLFLANPAAGLLPPKAAPFHHLAAGLFILNFAGYSNWHLVSLAPYFLFLAGFFFYALKRGPWKGKLLFLSMLLGYLVFPREGQGGGHLNERFLPFLILFLPLGLDFNVAKIRLLRRIHFGAFLLVAGGVFWGMGRIDAIVREAEGVLRFLPGQSRLYAINFNISGPARNYSSLMHLWAVYDDDKIVFSPNLFAHMNLMPLSRKHPSTPEYFPAPSESLADDVTRNEVCRPADLVATVDCEKARSRTFETLLAYGAFYDYWFVVDPPPDFLEKIKNREGVQITAQGTRMLLVENKAARPFSPPL